jgi:hypothetical protein
MSVANFAEKNKHLNQTIEQCKEHCEKNEMIVKNTRAQVYRADHTRENDRDKKETDNIDVRDEEDEIKTITNEDMIDA